MLILSGVTFVVGAALSAGAEHISMVVLGRLVLGLGVGGGTTVRAQPRPAGGYAFGFHHVLFRVGMVWSWVGSMVGLIARCLAWVAGGSMLRDGALKVCGQLVSSWNAALLPALHVYMLQCEPWPRDCVSVWLLALVTCALLGSSAVLWCGIWRRAIAANCCTCRLL